MSRIEPIIERLHGLYPRLIDLGLDRLQRLMGQLGHPELQLPPAIHVAGTNGKGSTCALVRAVAEAAGWRTHVYTSPHLVRFNERFRIAGQLVTDEALAGVLERIEEVNGGAPITVFEVITAAAFVLFAEAPAELCVLEVGLGGRGDATNVITRPAACAITSISMDHAELLGTTLAAIAAEKAGIMKPGVPVVTGTQTPDVLAMLRDCADAAGAPLLARGRDWEVAAHGGGLQFTDPAGSVELPTPSLPGAHQVDNAGIAAAALRAWRPVPAGAWAGMARAAWPARLQQLHGKLAALLPAEWELWLDGGHNPGAAEVLAAHLHTWQDRPAHLVVGMKQSKDPTGFLGPLLPLVQTVWAVQEPDQHLAIPVPGIIEASGGVARPGPTVADALRSLAALRPVRPSRVLVCGSLYLAGPVLKGDDWHPA